jgi:Intu longin-like domain 2/Intu longin-like domain 3
VHETVFKRILQRAYQNFRLFCNTFEHHLTIGDTDTDDEKIENLRSKLEHFYTKYLLRMNLQNADLHDAIQCLQYKAVTHTTFFRIVNFINMLTSIKSLKIRKCIFLYYQEVVYSSINPMDLFIINEYMTEYLFPKYFQLRNNQSYDIDQNVGGFVTENESESLANAPKIHLYGEGKFEIFRLVIYKIMDVSLVMLVDDVEDSLNEEFCNEIKYSIGPQIGMISKEIADNFHLYQNTITTSKGGHQQNDDNIQEKYIYFNHRNFRFHACFGDSENTLSNRDGKRNVQLTPSVMNLLCDLYAQEVEEDNSAAMINTERETIFKTYNDQWIVRRFYNYRSFYLILHKSSTLIDIADESQRLLDLIVKNVYISNLQ